MTCSTRSLLVFVFAWFLSLDAGATHNRSIEITYRHVSGFTYEATVITYTEANSQADRDTVDMNWGDGSLSAIVRTNGPVVGGIPKGIVLSNNVKLNEYTGTHTYPGPGDYKISAHESNRISSIVNINGGASVNTSIYVESLLRIPGNVACVNNSAVPVAPLTIGGKLLSPLKVNVGSYDPDGDSLSFELVTPQQAADFPVPNYLFPDEVSAGASQFELNAKTGELTWNNPQQQGTYSIAILVSEWRGQQLVGTVLRDFMFLIDDFNADYPAIRGTDQWNTDADGNFYFAIDPGDTLSLAITSSPDMLDPIVTAFSDAFDQNVPPVFNAQDTQATLTWVPDIQSARAAPYLIVLRASYSPPPADIIQEDVTVMVKVNGNDSYGCAAVGLFSPKQQTTFTVAPNPFSDFTLIRLPEIFSSGEVELSLYDLSGKLLVQYRESYAPQLKVSRNDLAKGTYILKADDGKKQNSAIAKITVLE